MKKFRARVIKKDRKVNLIVTRETLEEAKVYLKKQGYAVIEINETFEVESSERKGEEFFFEALIGPTERKGRIYSEDMFWAYIKLVDELEYKVVAIYKEEDTDERTKKLNTSSLERSYKLFKQEQKKKIRQKTVIKNTKKEFYAQKKIKKLHEVTKNVEIYVKTYIKNTNSEENMKDLYEIITEIKKISSSSNMDKIRTVLQSALTLVGERQIEDIKKNNIKDVKKYLQETNSLLKKAGIKKTILPIEGTVFGQIQGMIKKLQTKKQASNIPKIQTKKKKKQKDYVYYQAKQNIVMYTKKQKQLQKNFWKHLLQTKKRKHISLQIEAVKKNIFILSRRVWKSRINTSLFSSRTRKHFSSVFIEIFHNGVSVITWSLFIFVIYFLSFYTFVQVYGTNIIQVFNVWSINVALVLFVSGAMFVRVRNVLWFVFSFGVSILFYVFLQVNFF